MNDASGVECKVDPAQLVALKTRLLDIIDPGADSVDCYHSGTNWRHRAKPHGANQEYDIDGALVV